MYREFAPEPASSELVQCTWLQRGVGVARIVPDACVDVMWDGRELRVAGPDTRPMLERVTREIHGVRLRTGVASAVLGVPASALKDARVDLRTLWGDEAARISDALQHDPRALESAIRTRRPLDAMVMQVVRRLREDPSLRVARLARELGVSERQLNRRCTDAVGYGPKFLARVLRMQHFVRAPDASLAALAAQLGFSDQAHLGHEAAELWGSTPAKLRARPISTSALPR